MSPSSASLRKSITDLTRRRARTAFAVATLALAVASISFFAIPTLIDRSMQREVRAERLADLTMSMRPLALDRRDLAALAALPNVAAVEPRNSVDTRVMVGARRAAARVIGVRDFDEQTVDVVRLKSGALPTAGRAMVDVQDANTDVYGGGTGDVATLVRGNRTARLPITGEARNIHGGEQVQDDGIVVLYAPAATVAALSGERGWSRLAFRLHDAGPAAARSTVAAIQRRLASVPGFRGFTDLPELRAAGDWPGKEDTEQFGEFLTVLTLLALLSALVLISNTMTTLVTEQTGEIAIMRAVGARRGQVARLYLRTAAMLGALGAAVGIALGIAVSNLAAGFFGMEFWAVDVRFGVDTAVLALSVLVGLVVTPLAALPAIRRGVRADLREALEASGSEAGGQGALDRALRRVSFLPRTMQVGLRGVGRRKRRSLATALIVALAVGNLLAILGLAAAATETTRTSWDDHLEDVQIWTAGSAAFDRRAERTIRSTPGVASIQPALVSDVALGDEDAVVWGVRQRPLFRHRVSDGRWFSPREERERARVLVIERNLARITGTQAGDDVTLSTGGGAATFRVVGVADNQQEYGTALFAPLTTVRTLLREPGASHYWVATSSPDHALIDRTTALLEDRLAVLGYEVGSEIRYVAKRDEIDANKTVTTSIAVLGFLIVAISLVGLANAMTMSVVERTREIGVLRCIGARARDVRRIFATEGGMLAVAGWLLGIPVGYALDRALVALVRDVANIDLPVLFPAANVVLALAGTVALALLVTILPIRRATRLRPGDALRYR
jgi:putative ABC transport system permease protein